MNLKIAARTIRDVTNPGTGCVIAAGTDVTILSYYRNVMVQRGVYIVGPGATRDGRPARRVAIPACPPDDLLLLDPTTAPVTLLELIPRYA